MKERDQCHDCGRPEADQDDWDRLHSHECDQDPCPHTPALCWGYLCEPVSAAELREQLERAEAEVTRLRTLINTPHTATFLEAVKLEAAHQRERWGEEHDARKDAPDWYWLVGYLAAKALHAWKAGATLRLKHHVVTTAAACLNWHRSI